MPPDPSDDAHAKLGKMGSPLAEKWGPFSRIRVSPSPQSTQSSRTPSGNAFSGLLRDRPSFGRGRSGRPE